MWIWVDRGCDVEGSLNVQVSTTMRIFNSRMESFDYMVDPTS